MNIDKLKDIYKHSKNYNISFSRDSLFELIENIESIARNAQIESEINESYYKENKKYKEVINKAIEYLESKRVREKAIIDVDVLQGILKEVEHE